MKRKKLGGAKGKLGIRDNLGAGAGAELSGTIGSVPEFRWVEGRPVLEFGGGRELCLDFVGDPRYLRKLRGKNELLAKAVGLKGTVVPRVWDLSLGLAEDAWTLARLGCLVHGFERQPLLYQLVNESLGILDRDGELHPRLVDARARISVSQAEALDVVRALAAGQDLSGLGMPQVLYFDPMYAGTTKSSALPRLEMQLLRAWLGEDQDQEMVLQAALKIKGLRVVVKRGAKAAALKMPVTHSFVGEKVRYDMYQNTGSLE